MEQITREEMIGLVTNELSFTEAVLTDPVSLRRMQAERIVNRVFASLQAAEPIGTLKVREGWGASPNTTLHDLKKLAIGEYELFSLPCPPAKIVAKPAYRCHACKAEAPPPESFKLYVKCLSCGELTAATIAEDLAQPAKAQVPEGWEISAAEGGRIVIKNKDGSGVVVEDSDRTEAIAENILHRLASALLTASPAPVAQEAKDQVLEDWPALNAFIQDYLDGYELRGDGDYTPNDKEKFLIEDCVAGLIDELGIKPSMVKKLTASPAPEHNEGQLEMVEVPFHMLALGTRFRYTSILKSEYVKISATQVARWQDDMAITGWAGQGVYSFDEKDGTNTTVLVAVPTTLRQQEEAEQ